MSTFLVFLVAANSIFAQDFRTKRPSVTAPKPIYLQEWADRGIIGKGVVLLIVDTKTGDVIGARMLRSTGSRLLDGSALEAFSRWKFKPGATAREVKIPIEFTNKGVKAPKT